MSTYKRKRELLPPWEMPSDPVKALLWFLHWLLKVVVRFFWLPLVVMVVYETWMNWSVSGAFAGTIGGVITILVGVFIWSVLYILLFFTNLAAGLRKIVSAASDFERQRSSFMSDPPDEHGARVVEGTITDLEQERNKRRKSQ